MKAKPSTPSPDDEVEPTTPSRKRPAAELDDAEGRPSKRPKPNGAPAVNMASPSKKRRLEEDGLLLLETRDEKIDDDPELITIDD